MSSYQKKLRAIINYFTVGDFSWGDFLKLKEDLGVRFSYIFSSSEITIDDASDFIDYLHNNVSVFGFFEIKVISSKEDNITLLGSDENGNSNKIVFNRKAIMPYSL